MTTILRRSSSWDPSELDNLAWWVKADDGVFANYQGTLPILADEPIGYLRDWSGNGKHGIQGTGAFSGSADSARPTFKENVLGTMPGMLFDGADYLNHQESLFNSATKYTIFCLLSSNAVSTASKRVMGVTGSGKIWSIGSNNASSWLQGDNNLFGSSEVADSASGTNFSFSARPLKTAMLVGIRAEQGVGAEIWVNGRVVGTSTWTSSAMATDQIFLLGTQNNTTSTTTINAVTASGWPAYIHEAFALDGHRATDAEMEYINRYFFRKWPGNYPHRRTADLNIPANGHLQGVASDGTYFYATHTSAIRKYNSSWGTVATNLTPFSGLGDSSDHIGDCDYHGGFIYAPIGVGQTTFRRIAKYNASDLSYVTASANDTKGHPPAVSVIPEHGLIAVHDFNTNSGASFDLYRLSDLSFIQSVTLSSPITGTQGTSWDGKRLRVHTTTTKVYSHKLDGSDVREDFDSYGSPQGLGYDFTTDRFQICTQSGSADHIVEMRRIYEG